MNASPSPAISAPAAGPVIAPGRRRHPVRLRPFRRDELDLVAALFAGLSAESQRRRFVGPCSAGPSGCCVTWSTAATSSRWSPTQATADHFQGRGIGGPPAASPGAEP